MAKKRPTASKRGPRAKKPHGRPQFFLDPKIKGSFLLWLRSGCTRADACKKVGCARRTINYALDREPEFRSQVEEAEVDGKLIAIGCVTKNAATNPTVALQYLSRKWPNEWAYRKPDVVTKTQFKSMIDQLIAHLLNIVPAEFHGPIMQGVNDMLLGVIGGPAADAEPEAV